jgi:hypothetical protein
MDTQRIEQGCRGEPRLRLVQITIVARLDLECGALAPL